MVPFIVIACLWYGKHCRDFEGSIVASFVANHRKKIERLERLEREIRRLIDSGTNRETLLMAALEIRDGRIRVLLAKQNQNPRNTADRAAFLKDKEDVKRLRALTAEMVLAEYLPN
jgi:hypothetical protein